MKVSKSDFDTFIGKWKLREEVSVKKILKKVAEAARLFATEGVDAATMFANTR